MKKITLNFLFIFTLASGVGLAREFIRKRVKLGAGLYHMIIDGVTVKPL